ncbi:hypothetical protein M9Y10_042589 [Tritrichomonas musculus]|uniref:Uncharacterized protein n=1 Tax=Tritrichomonas musculus TaxID=1915356 RepID=A0ABR2JXQ2_9EUKA
MKFNSKFEPSIEISHYLFEEDKSTSSSSLFYVRESNKNQRIGVKVSECIFSGEVRDGSHHIDGKVRSNEGNFLNNKFENGKFS